MQHICICIAYMYKTTMASGVVEDKEVWKGLINDLTIND